MLGAREDRDQILLGARRRQPALSRPPPRELRLDVLLGERPARERDAALLECCGQPTRRPHARVMCGGAWVWGWRTVLWERRCVRVCCMRRRYHCRRLECVWGAHARRHAINDRADALAVRLAKGGDAEDRAEGRHAAGASGRERAEGHSRSSTAQSEIGGGSPGRRSTAEPGGRYCGGAQYACARTSGQQTSCSRGATSGGHILAHGFFLLRSVLLEETLTN